MTTSKRFSVKSMTGLATALTICVGGMVLVGWVLDVPALKSILPGWVTMKFNTALAFVLAGVSLGLLNGENSTTLSRLGRLLAGGVVLIGLLTTLEYVFGWDLGLDQLFIHEAPTAVATSSPGRMALTTAVSFTCIGLVLVFLDALTRGGRPWSSYLLVPPAILSLFALIGYLFGQKSLYRLGPFTAMALHTTLTFLVLLIGILLARPKRGLVAILADPGPGGVAARRLLPSAILVPVVVGWLRLQGEKAGYFDSSMGVAIVAVCHIGILIVLTWWVSRSLSRQDTARRQAEEALATSETRYRTLFDNSSDALITLSPPTWQFTSCNPAAVAMFGTRGAEHFASLGPAELSPTQQPDGRASADKAREMIATAMRDGSHFFEWTHQRVNGESFPATVLLSRTEIDGKAFLQATVRDITERKRAETLVQASEAKYRALVETTKTGYLILDAEGKVVDANSEYVRLTGRRDVRDIHGRSVLEWTAEYEKETNAMAVAQCARDGFIRDLVIDYIDAAGRITPVEINATVINDGEGVRILSLCRDITERVQVEAAVQAKNKELEQFTYSVSHDLRSPLVTIQTFLGHLEQDIPAQNAARVATDLGFIRAAASKMAQMLDELLNLSRLGRQANPPVAVPLQDIVQEVLALVAGRIAQRGVQVSVRPEPVTLHGDRPRLVEVFQNLIDNACKFMGDQKDPRLEIGVETRGAEPLFFVRDNGSGIEPGQQEKVFGLFVRFQPHVEGTGLGLTLVKRIIEVHGGRIWVESKGAGQGACFYFTLPGAVA